MDESDEQDVLEFCLDVHLLLNDLVNRELPAEFEAVIHDLHRRSFEWINEVTIN